MQELLRALRLSCRLPHPAADSSSSRQPSHGTPEPAAAASSTTAAATHALQLPTGTCRSPSPSTAHSDDTDDVIDGIDIDVDGIFDVPCCSHVAVADSDPTDGVRRCSHVAVANLACDPLEHSLRLAAQLDLSVHDARFLLEADATRLVEEMTLRHGCPPRCAAWRGVGWRGCGQLGVWGGGVGMYSVRCVYDRRTACQVRVLGRPAIWPCAAALPPPVRWFPAQVQVAGIDGGIQAQTYLPSAYVA